VPELTPSVPDAPWIRRSIGKATALARVASNAGTLHYIVAIFAVQGLSYATQFTIAKVAGPADFAVVRTVEATLNVLLVVASMGMPMLAVTTIAGLRSESDQGRMVGGLLAISVFGGLCVAFVASLISLWLDAPGSKYLRELAWVLAITAGSRTSLNYFQGKQQVQRVAGFSVMLSLISLAVVIAAVWAGGLQGWVIGRYASEALFLGMMLRAIGPTLSFSGPLPSGQTVEQLLRAGSGIAVSLLIRTAGDNAGIFMLNAFGASRPAIGYFGLSSLALVAILIVPGAIPSVALPRLVARLSDRTAVLTLVRKVGLGSLAASVMFAFLTAVIAAPLVRAVLPSYGPAIPILNVLLFAVPFRLMSSMSGMVLVACNAVRYTVWINILALIVTVGLGWPLTLRIGALGAAIAVVAGEAISALAYALSARTQLNRRLSSASASGVALLP
jgi:O-antigen/teichoic acid export membrane protein